MLSLNLDIKIASSYYVILVRNFVLTFINKKAIYKSSTVLCKNMLSDTFEFFKKEKEFYKEKCGQLKK